MYTYKTIGDLLQRYTRSSAATVSRIYNNEYASNIDNLKKKCYIKRCSKQYYKSQCNQYARGVFVGIEKRDIVLLRSTRDTETKK